MSGIALCAMGTRLAGVSASAGAASVANLLTPSPKEAWVGAAGASSVVLDFGVGQPWDTAFLGFTTAAPGSTWSLCYGDSPSADTVAFTGRPIIEPYVYPGFDPADGRLVHLYARLVAPVASRYVRIDIQQPGGAAAVRASILIAGLSFEPHYGKERGSGRGLIDTGSRERLVDGGFGINDGVVKGVLQWTFGDLSDIEADQLYAFARTRGERRPVVVVDGSDVEAGLQERLNYGVFDRIEVYERRDTGKTRWSFRIEDWA